MTSYLTSAAGIAENTPAGRNRVVDLMRVVSILVVVFGHWLMAAVTIQNGSLVPGHLLAMAGWTHPLTWLLQVMPIFFFVGGYANALSWRSARDRGETYAGWLRTRLRRLTLPVVPLLLIWGVGSWIALQAGIDWETLKLASQVAIVPTWFLAAYVVIVALAPLALKVWEKTGWRSVFAGLALAAATDVLSISFGFTAVAFLNYVFVWGTVHQLGYAWVDGSFGSRRVRYVVLLTGLAAVLALVAIGPYQVAMVGVDTGVEIANSNPPRVTLAFLGMFQAGLVLVAEPLLTRVANVKKVWIAVIAISSQIMTIYLWHLTAMVLVIGAGVASGGFGFESDPLSAAWWLGRPIWFTVLSLLTVLLAMGLGRFERPRSDPRPSPASWRPLVAVILICAGLGSLATSGIADQQGLNGLALMLPIIGMISGGVIGAQQQKSRFLKV